MSSQDDSTWPLPSMLAAAGLDTVEGAFAYSSGRDITVVGLGHRQRWTLTLSDPTGQPQLLFMKRYGREPLKWRLQRRFTYGRGGSPASVELNNIHAAHIAGVPTIDQAAGGHEPEPSGARRSYIIMTAVAGEALEQCAEGFVALHGLGSCEVAQFTHDLAQLVRRFHQAGYVHRDLYTSHIFMVTRPGGVELRLIDLARMFAPSWRRFRWRVKDLAQLKYSMPPGWVDRHWNSFMASYLEGRSSRARWRYERAIDLKVASITQHVERKRRRKARRERV
jgi:tRNA A-37 threonylcarbamoyl transferase component Bud32